MAKTEPNDPVVALASLARASRRQFLAVGGAGTLGAALTIPTLTGQTNSYGGRGSPGSGPDAVHRMGGLGTVGDVAPDQYYDPMRYLSTWNQASVPRALGEFYRETLRGDGSRLREYVFVAIDRTDPGIEIAPGVYFPAWTYNGQVPGPTIRATEGDQIRIRFINQGTHPHTIHFHGWHPSEMDGSFPHQFVEPGEEFIYEFVAEPVGLHLYHCHSVPLKRHIHKGLYGVFIVDPRPDLYEGALHEVAKTRNPDHPEHRQVRELIMIMNAFDTDFDADNEVYAVNTVGFHYMRHPIVVRVGELVRVYLVNITEFDPINSFHLHAGFFDVYRTGTKLETAEHTDTVMLCQAERAILEFRLRWPGQYMFHAHQSEFAELGWMGAFEALDRDAEFATRAAQPVYPAPDFALEDATGQTIRLSDFRSRAHVVLVFSLGASCLHCSEQLRGLVAQASALRSQQSETVVVTRGREAMDVSPVHLVTDPTFDVASLYGLTRNGPRRHGTFLIDRAGTVRWQNVGEQPFMDYSELIEQLRKLNS